MDVFHKGLARGASRQAWDGVVSGAVSLQWQQIGVSNLVKLLTFSYCSLQEWRIVKLATLPALSFVAFSRSLLAR